MRRPARQRARPGRGQLVRDAVAATGQDASSTPPTPDLYADPSHGPLLAVPLHGSQRPLVRSDGRHPPSARCGRRLRASRATFARHLRQRLAARRAPAPARSAPCGSPPPATRGLAIAAPQHARAARPWTAGTRRPRAPAAAGSRHRHSRPRSAARSAAAGSRAPPLPRSLPVTSSKLSRRTAATAVASASITCGSGAPQRLAA